MRHRSKSSRRAVSAPFGRSLLSFWIVVLTAPFAEAWRYERNDTYSYADAAAVDGNGDVLVAGLVTNTNADLAVVKLSAADGSEIWRREIDDGPGDYPRQLVVDAAGNVVVLAELGGTHVIKLAGADGAELWRVNLDSSPLLVANDLVLDAAGNVFVAGSAGADFTVAKLASATGAELWRTEVDGMAGDTDAAQSVVAAANGDAIAAGYLTNGVYSEFAAIRFDGVSGTEVWRTLLSGPGSLGNESAESIAIAGNGDLLVAGSLNNGVSRNDFSVVRLSPGGTEIWRQSIPAQVPGPGTGSGVAFDVIVDPGGAVAAYGFTDFPDVHVVVRLSGASGAEIWRRKFSDLTSPPALLADASGDVFFGLGSTKGAFEVVKMAAATGATLWDRSIRGSADNGTCLSLARTASNDIVAAGVLFNGEAFTSALAVFGISNADGVVGPLTGRSLVMTDSSADPTRRKLVALLSDSAVAAPLPGSVDNPVTAGAKLRLVNPITAESSTFTLPGGSLWKGLGNPAGSKGYKYVDSTGANGPCRQLLVRGKRIKAVCLGSLGSIPFSLDEASQESLTVAVQFGAGASQCASFGGTVVRNQGTANPGPVGSFRGRNAAPFSGDCPVP